MGLLLSVQLKIGQYGFRFLKIVVNFLSTFNHSDTFQEHFVI